MSLPGAVFRVGASNKFNRLFQSFERIRTFLSGNCNLIAAKRVVVATNNIPRNDKNFNSVLRGAGLILSEERQLRDYRSNLQHEWEGRSATYFRRVSPIVFKK